MEANLTWSSRPLPRPNPTRYSLGTTLALIGIVGAFAVLLATLIRLQLDRDAQDFRSSLVSISEEATEGVHADLHRSIEEALDRLAAIEVGDARALRRFQEATPLVEMPFQHVGGAFVWPPSRARHNPTELPSTPLSERLLRAERRAQERASGSDRVLAERTFATLLEERLPPEAFARNALRFASFLAEDPERLDVAITWCRRASRAAVDAGLPDLQLFARLRQVELLSDHGRPEDAARVAGEALTLALRDDVFFAGGPAVGFVIEQLWRRLERPELRAEWPPELQADALRARQGQLEREAIFTEGMPSPIRVALELGAENGATALAWSDEPPSITAWRRWSPKRAAGSDEAIADDGIVGFRAPASAGTLYWTSALESFDAHPAVPDGARLVSPAGTVLAATGHAAGWPSENVIAIERPLGRAPLRVEIDWSEAVARERRRRARAYGGLAAVALLVLAGGGWAVRLGVRRQLELAATRARFVADVSHDLRTPLTQIRLFTDILREGYQRRPEDVEQSLSIIAREVDGLELLIDNVLELARRESTRPESAAMSVDAGEVVRGLVEAQRPSLERQGFTVAVVLPETPATVGLDRTKLEQALRNLISNAVKYSQQDKALSIEVARVDAGVELRVADRGPGLPVNGEALFERFTRGDDPAQAHIGGAGIGLSIVRQIVEEQGGRVVATARPGGGSIFTLWLPEPKGEA